MYRLFNLDTHVSIISDIKDIFQKLYGDSVQITNWSISGDRWVFGFPYVNVKHITQRSWKNINKEMIDAFHREYDSYMSQFDGFIVTHTPVFAQLFEKYNKPIIMVNSCRYNQPFCWNSNFQEQYNLNESLKRMVTSGQLYIVSNNKADQEYLRLGTGLNSTWIPSLCAYTKEKHNPNTQKDVGITYGYRENYPSSDYVLNKRNGSTWKEIYSNKVIIHHACEVSSMSISEQYTAGVPLLLPSKEYYTRLADGGTCPLTSIYMKQCHDDFYDAFEPTFDLQFWIDRADFYDQENMPYIYYYDSPEDAITKAADFKEDSDVRAKRDAFIAERQAKILSQWDQIFKTLFKEVPKAPLKICWDQPDKQGFELCSQKHIGQINRGTLIGDMIYNLVQDTQWKNFLEVGTWNGLGSTKCIFEGLNQRTNDKSYKFWSLECNSEKSEVARSHYKEENVFILNEVLFNKIPEDIYENFPILKENAEFKKWFEIDMGNMYDKPLFLERKDIPEIFDFVLLDGGDFTTYHEFMLLKEKFNTIIIYAINTNKGSLIKQYLVQNSDKYKIIMEHPEKNGFLVAKRTT
jgi:hypothetical protein